MEEGSSKIVSFWGGMASAIPLFIVLNIILTLVRNIIPGGGVQLSTSFPIPNYTILFTLLPILLMITILIVFLFIFRKYHTWKYFFLGVLTFIGAVLIFFGTCFAGVMIDSKASPGSWGIGGAILSLPFAIGFAIWFLVAIARKVTKISKEGNKMAERQEVLQ